EPGMVSALGYYDFRFGATGIEAVHDEWLRSGAGRTTWQIARDDLLHRPEVGGDIRTTLDLTLQRALYEALTPYQGAAIIAEAGSGDVLALVSVPSYDPALLDELVSAADADEDAFSDDRLVNRAVNAYYQPGGALQTLLMSTLLAAGLTPDTPTTTQAIPLAGQPILLSCPRPAPHDTDLSSAYRAGCPAPFLAALGDVFTPARLDNAFEAAGLWETPRLAGFRVDTNPPERVPMPADRLDLTAEVAGQGAIVVSPLHMAQLIGAVVNDGQAPALRLVDARRATPSADWEPLPASSAQTAIMQPDVAQQLRAILRAEALLDDPTLYGHLSRGYAGEQALVWLLGWAPQPDGRNLIMVLVLETPPEGLHTALDVARAALQAVD
ncbi:MAG: penicillin-binding transpeptidase domain-containing protein, partial [Anaerolineales bacterium]